MWPKTGPADRISNLTIVRTRPRRPPDRLEPLLWCPRPLRDRTTGTHAEFEIPVPESTGRESGRMVSPVLVNLAQDFHSFAQCLLWARLHRMRVLLAPDRESAAALIGHLPFPAPSLLFFGETARSADARSVIPQPDPPKPREGNRPVPSLPRGRIALWSSGTTQSPCLHYKSWTQLVESADAVSRRVGIRNFSHVLSTVPPYHLYGLEHGLFMPWRNGVGLYRRRLFFPLDVREAASLGTRGVLVTTPFHLRALVESGLRVTGLGLIICSTAPLSTALARKSEQRFKVPVMEVYGSTETGALATRRTVREEPWHLLDHVSLSQREGRPCVIRRRTGTARFLDDEVVVLDSSHLRLLGRRQDIVKVAGRRASLAALNHTLLEIPGVQSGAFYQPREQESRGEPERLVAFVTAPGVQEKWILAQLRKRIEGIFLPRPLVVVEEIPHLPTGKISHAVLTGLYREHVAVPADSPSR